ncbi:hypothetical protein [Methylopila turkensis]|uniref:Uncharacterized protein n=1 Tax=Methylopila turkensis TaxID=1437816 RepID=A0A9W6JMA1_9HYPH|nr:hypothetical protein [Methylopila turkensis]GLK79772.1 hypothetical protein GCM10008174_15130 [Methylopila turkensis]
MVEPALYAAFGACVATLLLLLFLPLFWNRAVRLTTRRLAGRLPISVSEIVAAQDRLRAEHAVSLRATERRAETMLAQAARERVEAGALRAGQLALKAEAADLRETVKRLETQNALHRGDLDRTSAEFADALKALDAAKLDARAANRGRDVARKEALAAQTTADALRVDLAAAEAALASARAGLAETEARLARTQNALTLVEAKAASAAVQLTEAQAGRLAAEKRLVEETAALVAARAESARGGAAPSPASASDDDLMIELRAKLDELADAIVRAEDGRPAEPARAKTLPPAAASGVTGLLPSHA